MLWSVEVRDKVYEVNAPNYPTARWAGVRKHLAAHFLDITASMLYQYARAYRVYGRKGVPY